MAAIVGFVIGKRFTQPAIAEIVVTSDGFVLARTDGEASETHFIGTYADVLRNWLRLIGLSSKQIVRISRLCRIAGKEMNLNML